MRLRTTFLGTECLPPCAIAFGWLCEKHVHIVGKKLSHLSYSIVSDCERRTTALDDKVHKSTECFRPLVQFCNKDVDDGFVRCP